MVGVSTPQKPQIIFERHVKEPRAKQETVSRLLVWRESILRNVGGSHQTTSAMFSASSISYSPAHSASSPILCNQSASAFSLPRWAAAWIIKALLRSLLIGKADFTHTGAIAHIYDIQCINWSRPIAKYRVRLSMASYGTDGTCGWQHNNTVCLPLQQRSCCSANGWGTRSIHANLADDITLQHSYCGSNET